MKLQLNYRLSQSDIHELCALTQGERNNSLKEQLYQLTLDADRRVATNALWVFTHFALADKRVCQNSLILKKSQSPDFHKPGLCYV